MNKKKKLMVSVITLFILLSSIVVVSLMQPVENEDELKGSFVKIKRYNEDQLKGKDIDVQNILLTDKLSIEEAIKKLTEYNEFTEQISSDLSSLIKQTSYLIEKEKEKTNPSHIIKKADEEMTKFKSFVDGNSHVIKSTLDIFYLLKIDNSKSGEIINNDTFTEYEYFRIEFANYYNNFILILPQLQNELLRLGKPGIFA